MPYPLPPRSPATVASVLAAAGIALAVAGCGGHVTPLGPGPPAPRHLRSPIVLEAMRSEPATAAGRCPAGHAAVSVSPGSCYRPVGTPLTITSAAVSPVPSRQPAPPGQPAGPPQYGFMIALSAAGRPALKAISTTAYDAEGYLDVASPAGPGLSPRCCSRSPTGSSRSSCPAGIRLTSFSAS